MDSAIQIYCQPSTHPRLMVQQHVVIRAVQSLDRFEALALIRGAFAREDGAFASLDEAKEIYALIMA